MPDYRIPDRSGAAFRVDAGETVAVVTPTGRQIADLVAFDRADPTEAFSQAYTRDCTGKVRLSTGDSLYSTAGEPLLTIRADDCGVHDVLFGPCTGWMLTDRRYGEGVQNEPGGCRENLSLALAALPEVAVERVPDTFNAFMASTVTDQTYVDVRESPAEAGDAVVFEADREVIVAVAACSAKGVGNGPTLSPIDLRLPTGTDVYGASVHGHRDG